MSVSSLDRTEGTFWKNSDACSTVMASTSAMLFPLYFTSSVSRLYLDPLQTSHVTYTSGRKCISILIRPSPSHASHLPPFTLKLYLPALYPRTRDSGKPAKRSRMGVNAPV